MTKYYEISRPQKKKKQKLLGQIPPLLSCDYLIYPDLPSYLKEGCFCLSSGHKYHSTSLCLLAWVH